MTENPGGARPGHGPPADLRFRPIDPGDSLDELTDLLHRAYASLAAMGLKYWATHQPAEDTRERVDSGETWVGVLDGRLVATVTLVPPGSASDAPWYERAGTAKIQQFAVDPELQGRGVGSALMDLIERRAVERGASEVALDTAEPAGHLIRFYERRGYRIVAGADWRPMTNYRSVILSLSLRSTPPTPCS